MYDYDRRKQASGNVNREIQKLGKRGNHHQSLAHEVGKAAFYAGFLHGTSTFG